jgi:hypothetical protein
LTFTVQSDALMGNYQEIHFYNKTHNPNYDHRIFSFSRWSDNEKLIIISNFDESKYYDLDLIIPEDLISKWQLENGTYQVEDQLNSNTKETLYVADGIGKVHIKLSPLESSILQLQKK